MKKIVLITAVAGLTLVAAAPPAHWNRSSGADEWAGRGYPPCSRTVTDRCIQLYERGVATRANLALNERLGMQNYAMGGPYEAVEPESAYVEEDSYGHDNGYADAAPEMESGWTPGYRDDYPPCSHGVSDRCIQDYEVGADY